MNNVTGSLVNSSTVRAGNAMADLLSNSSMTQLTLDFNDTVRELFSTRELSQSVLDMMINTQPMAEVAQAACARMDEVLTSAMRPALDKLMATLRPMVEASQAACAQIDEMLIATAQSTLNTTELYSALDLSGITSTYSSTFAAMNSMIADNDTLSSFLRATNTFEPELDFSMLSSVGDVQRAMGVRTFLPNELAGTKVLQSKETLVQDRRLEVVDYSLRDCDLSRDVEQFLYKLDPELVNLYHGAVYGLSSTNPDWIRHISVSLREMVTHLLHILAPNEDVRAWNSAETYYDKRGKPTRRARVRYICSSIGDQQTDYIEYEVNAILGYHEVLQAGTHSIAPPFGRQWAFALVLRARALLIMFSDLNLRKH